jgi:hypothetical protein
MMASGVALYGQLRLVVSAKATILIAYFDHQTDGLSSRDHNQLVTGGPTYGTTALVWRLSVSIWRDGSGKGWAIKDLVSSREL